MRFGIVTFWAAWPVVLAAQQPVTRAEAVAAALARGARVVIGRADTVAALGAVRSARAFPNPTVSGSYSQDPPHYHALGDLPLDLPWLRAPRTGAAEAARDAARYHGRPRPRRCAGPAATADRAADRPAHGNGGGPANSCRTPWGWERRARTARRRARRRCRLARSRPVHRGPARRRRPPHE